MGVRTELFSAVFTALSSASLTASDSASSSRTVTIKGEYSDKTDSLPVVTVSKVNNPTEGTFFYGGGSIREPRIIIDVYSNIPKHVEQLADQIDDYLWDNPISGYMLVGLDDSDELSPANDNKVHRKSMFLTYNKVL